MHEHAGHSRGARSRAARFVVTLPLAALAAACPSRPQAPRVPPAADVTFPINGSVRGVAGSGALLFASTATSIQAYRGGAVAWTTPLAGAGPIAAGETLVAVTTSVTSPSDGGPTSTGGTSAASSAGATKLVVRGDPASGVTAVDAATGATKWTVLFDSTEWSIATSIAMLGNDVIVAGSFGGTLRAGSHVVSSAGGSDGFVARIRASGELAWLIRLGGAGSDGVQGVATHADAGDPKRERIAIAGTFASGAELGGVALPAYDDRVPWGDAFIAELDGTGARRWQTTLGGRGDDALAGVAIAAQNRVIVAASGKEVIHVGSAQLVTQGESDGVVAWFGDDGEKGAAVLVGGMDFDGLRAITAVGDKVVVGGFFSGSIKLAERTLTAGGGDDAFLAALDANGTVATVWHVGGEGREEITSLSSVPGGFVAGVAHTANANVEGAQLAAPKDPMAGGALIVRGGP